MVCSWMGLASTKPAFSISANNSADKLNSLNFNSFFFLKSGAKPLYHTSFSMRKRTDCIGSHLPGYLSQDSSKGKANRFSMEFPLAKNVFALADLVD